MKTPYQQGAFDLKKYISLCVNNNVKNLINRTIICHHIVHHVNFSAFLCKTTTDTQTQSSELDGDLEG